MSEIILPTIPHADVTLNARNRVIISMDEGWVFWDRNHYSDYTDDEGNPRDPFPEEISYYRWGSYSPATDFSCIIVVAEEDVPPYQIYSDEPAPKPEIM